VKVRILPPDQYLREINAKRAVKKFLLVVAATCGFGPNALVILIANVAELGKAHPSQLAPSTICTLSRMIGTGSPSRQVR
jgi:hypothetical protein